MQVSASSCGRGEWAVRCLRGSDSEHHQDSCPQFTDGVEGALGDDLAACGEQKGQASRTQAAWSPSEPHHAKALCSLNLLVEFFHEVTKFSPALTESTCSASRGHLEHLVLLSAPAPLIQCYPFNVNIVSPRAIGWRKHLPGINCPIIFIFSGQWNPGSFNLSSFPLFSLPSPLSSLCLPFFFLSVFFLPFLLLAFLCWPQSSFLINILFTHLFLNLLMKRYTHIHTQQSTHIYSVILKT